MLRLLLLVRRLQPIADRLEILVGVLALLEDIEGSDPWLIREDVSRDLLQYRLFRRVRDKLRVLIVVVNVVAHPEELFSLVGDGNY